MIMKAHTEVARTSREGHAQQCFLACSDGHEIS
jgi:hypothetical protein